MNLISVFIYPCISVLALYILERKFSYKIKLITFLGSGIKYKIILVSLVLAATLALTFFYDMPIGSSRITTTLYFSYFYLVAIPKELR